MLRAVLTCGLLNLFAQSAMAQQPTPTASYKQATGEIVFDGIVDAFSLGLFSGSGSLMPDASNDLGFSLV